MLNSNLVFAPDGTPAARYDKIHLFRFDAEGGKESYDEGRTIQAGNAPVAMRGMKRAINEFARGELDEEAADQRARESMRGAEIKEGIKAFGEKRAPKF